MVKMWNSVDEFYDVMSRLRACRLHLVSSLLKSSKANVQNSLDCLKWVQKEIDDSRLPPECSITLAGENGKKISLNIKDEVLGVEKDVHFANSLLSNNVETFVVHLALYHPVNEKLFHQEVDSLEAMLWQMLRSNLEMLITDWDGTMKTYCSNYRTSVQPAYSAYWLAVFAKHCTHLTAVLTAGPLRDFGILDLVAVPVEESDVIFGGSWGREWLIENRRRVDKNSFSAYAEENLDKLTSCILKEINDNVSFHRFLMTGSGFQRKVDRITIGLQTVTGDVSEQDASAFLASILQTLKRVDPDGSLFWIRREKLDIEIVVKGTSQCQPWTKADGVKLLLRETGRSLTAGCVWICGDTESDLPMLEYSLTNNPSSTFTTFVNPNDEVRSKIASLMHTDNYRFIGCPEVLHAALERVLRKRGACTI